MTQNKSFWGQLLQATEPNQQCQKHWMTKWSASICRAKLREIETTVSTNLLHMGWGTTATLQVRLRLEKKR